MSKPRDMFGFIIGSKKSRAAKMYMEGATSYCIKYAGLGNQLNLLHDVESKGHKVVKHRVHMYGKNLTMYTIKVNWGIINNPEMAHFNWHDPSLAQLKILEFFPFEINDLVVVYLIPFYMRKKIPNGTKIREVSYGLHREHIWGSHYAVLDPWRLDGRDYLRYGLVATRE